MSYFLKCFSNVLLLNFPRQVVYLLTDFNFSHQIHRLSNLLMFPLYLQTPPLDASRASATTGTDSLPPTNVKRRDTFPGVITDPIIKHAVISSGSEQSPGPFPKDEKQIC